MSNKQTYLVKYPTYWPIFSVKNYTKDVDGWWNWNPKKRKPRSEKVDISSLLKVDDNFVEDIKVVKNPVIIIK